VDNKGRAISLALDEIDLAQLKDVMNGVAGFFTGWDGYLDDLQNAGP
jgi:hypothetical protein